MSAMLRARAVARLPKLLVRLAKKRLRLRRVPLRPQPKYPNQELREMKKRLASINRKMGTAGDKVKAKEAEMAAADPTDFVRLGELQAELNDLKAKKEAMEDEWLELAEALGVEQAENATRTSLCQCWLRWGISAKWDYGAGRLHVLRDWLERGFAQGRFLKTSRRWGR